MTQGERQTILKETLERILSVLKTNYSPQQIILFGSAATGEINPESDLDLFIVKETDKRYYDRIRDVVAMCDYTIGVDFIVYTPQELAEATQNNPFIKNEVLAKGKVIYREAA